MNVVAPFVGAWIEIDTGTSKAMCLKSLRSSERGLKLGERTGEERAAAVAPFVGAWIEMTYITHT